MSRRGHARGIASALALLFFFALAPGAAWTLQSAPAQPSTSSSAAPRLKSATPSAASPAPAPAPPSAPAASSASVPAPPAGTQLPPTAAAGAGGAPPTAAPAAPSPSATDQTSPPALSPASRASAAAPDAAAAPSPQAAPPLPATASPPPALLPSAAPGPPPREYLHDVFYATDAASGIASFRAHADEVGLVAPQCFSLDRRGDLHGALPADLLAIARAHHVPVMPLVINEDFSRRQAHLFLHDPYARDRALGALLETARDNGLAGYQIDFEGLYWTDRNAFSRFITDLGSALHRHGLILSVAVGARTDDDQGDNFRTYSGVYDYARLAAASDFLSVMAYPEHNGSDPGPLASTPWVRQVIQFELRSIPPDKFSLGIPTYQTDWSERRVRVSIWRRIGRRLRRFFRWTYHLLGHDGPSDPGQLEWDPQLQSAYRVQGSGIHRHVTWVEDARSFAAKLALVRQYHLRGFSVWRLGLEDPGIWAMLPAPAGPRLLEAAAHTRERVGEGVTSLADPPVGAAAFHAAVRAEMVRDAAHRAAERDAAARLRRDHDARDAHLRYERDLRLRRERDARLRRDRDARHSRPRAGRAATARAATHSARRRAAARAAPRRLPSRRASTRPSRRAATRRTASRRSTSRARSPRRHAQSTRSRHRLVQSAPPGGAASPPKTAADPR